MTQPLYHFTCGHALDGITSAGLLLSPFAQNPMRHNPAYLTELVWLTTLDAPYRDVLALPPGRVGCDRTDYRVTCQWNTGDVEPWVHFRRRLLRAEPDHPAAPWLARLHALEAARPAMWFVSDRPVPIKLVERTHQVGLDVQQPKMIYPAELTTPKSVSRETEPPR